MVHALPVLAALRRRFPQAQLSWLVAGSCAPVLAGNPLLAEVIEFDRRRYGRMWYSPSAATAFLSFVRKLRSRRFDLVIDLQGLFRSGFLARASGAAVRIGFAEARELAWVFYTHRLPPSGPDLHAVDRNWAAATLLGCPDGERDFALHCTDAERVAAGTLLADAGLPAGEPFVAVLPGARWETKRWTEAGFADLIDGLQVQLKRRAVLLGGPDEVPTCLAIARLCRTAPINLCGRTALRELIAVLERAALVICHDSGPMHLAVALHRPLVSIIGPTNPRRTGPYGRLDTVVSLKLACAPCYFRRLAQCPHAHACMRQLPADQVLRQARVALDLTSLSVDS